MKILITGASGFLGRCLSRYLDDHEIIAASRRDLDLLSSGAVREFLFQNKFDWIINCAVAGRHSINVVSSDIISNNLVMFANLYTNLDLVGAGMITIGSGAEYDLTKNIELAQEQDIWTRSPVHSYGFSKNLISRLSSMHPKCFTLRVFGCFDPSEDQQRPIKKLSLAVEQGQSFLVDRDRWFDMVSVWDLAQAVRYVLYGSCKVNDFNVVYRQKNRLSDIFRLYCELNGADPGLIKILGQGLSYTGDSSRIDALNLPLAGLVKSLEGYGK